jgi:biopolymer transport protein ExbD/biopolymer transport protein TolR
MAGKRHRKFSVKPALPPNSEINITPLVDVVLVLLIIFMVVTPLLEKDIEVKVPPSEQVDQPDEVPPDQLVVSLDKAGNYSINSEQVAEADYVERLKRVLAAKAKGDRLVFFVADDQTNYAKLVGALDGARLAGAETLGMMTDKLEQPAAPPAPPAPPATP